MPWPFRPPPPPHAPPPHAPPLVTIVLDLGHSCQCYGCLQKTSRVLNKFPGVKKHSYDLERNQIKLTGNVDPDVVVMKIAKIKKHVRVSAVNYLATGHMPPLEDHRGMTQPPMPLQRRPHGHRGSCHGCDNVSPRPPHSGLMHGPLPPHGHGGTCHGCDHAPPPAHGGPTQGPPPSSGHQPPPHGHSCSRRGCDHDHTPLPAQGGPMQCPPPPHGHKCSCGGCDHAPPPLPPAAQPPRQSVHMHVTDKGKSPSCHPPPPLPRHTCVNGQTQPPPPPIQHSHKCNEPPPQPPSSAFRCPPPQHHHNAPATQCHPPPPPNHHAAAAAHLPQPPNNPADQLNKLLHLPSSPLIPYNVPYTSILGHLAKIPKLKNVELIKKKGIKFGLQDGHIKSCHPINHMEVRPVHDCAALPHHHQHPYRYISPFSDENVNSSCTIM